MRRSAKIAKAKATQSSARRYWRWPARKVHVSRIVRELNYTNAERKRLLDKVNKTVERDADGSSASIKSLDAKHDPSKSERAAQGATAVQQKNLQDRSGKAGA